MDWNANQQALKSLPFGASKGIRKMAAGHIGVSKKMKEWKFQEHNTCPRCGAPTEDSKHILQCPLAQDLWTSKVSSLRSWMISKKTHPQLVKAICSNLSTWGQGDCLRHLPPELEEVLKVQAEVGWFHFVMGKAAKHVQIL